MSKVILSGCACVCLILSRHTEAFTTNSHISRASTISTVSRGSLQNFPSAPSLPFHYRKSKPLNNRDRAVSLFASPVPGIGDEGCALPSPSMVNTLPVTTQALVVFGICLGLYGLTVGTIAGIDLLKEFVPGALAFGPIVLGPLFMLAGLSHFTNQSGFENMMPAQGAWGFWYLPGSKGFHVAWTGAVEFLAGLWLAIGAVSTAIFGISLPDAFQLGTGSITADASLVLLVLTILVTPANIYMYTHGALLPPYADVPIPVPGHIARGVMQALLFASFYEMAEPTIYILQNLAV